MQGVTRMQAEQPLVRDVDALFDLIEHFRKKKALLARSKDMIYQRIRDFFVVKEEGVVIGCAMLHIYSAEYAEIGSLAVYEEHQKKGIGNVLIEEGIRRTHDLGITNIFALTFVPGFFKRHGFTEIDKDDLPHKIWKDCLGCPFFPNCNEVALIKRIIP